MKKLLFVFNPYSGKAQIKNKLLEILKIFVKYEYSVEVFPTAKAGDAREIIEKRGIEFDRIVISGGDGTLNESINGIMKIKKEKRPYLGYIPAGTTNDFASNLKIPKNMIKAAEIAVSGEKFSCDVGCFGEKNYLYVAAFGAFSDVAYDTPQMNKNYFGQLAYVLEGIKKLHNLKSYKLNVITEEKNFSGEYIFGMASNSNYIAGMKAKSSLNAQLNDGLFEILLIKYPKNILDFQMIISDLLTQNFSSDNFVLFKTNKAQFVFDKEAPWTIDGEYGGSLSKIEIGLENNAVDFSSGINNV